jgi:DNA-directed RNA polymerase subunit RPC12/RpoP
MAISITDWTKYPENSLNRLGEFRCPQCKTIVAISSKIHSIAEDGTLTPSMVCPHCPFHEWIKLEGW